MSDETLRLVWPDPAADWTAAIPLGNGRIGAMVFGGAQAARYQLNDSTVWSGDPDGPARALAAVVEGGAGPERLAAARAAIDSGDYRAAEALLMTFEGDYSQEFLPLADLVMDITSSGVRDYEGRELDLDDAVATEKFSVGDIRLIRRSWVSALAGTLCIALEARGGAVDLTLALTTPLRTFSQEERLDGLLLGIDVPIDGAPLHEPGVADPHAYRDPPITGGFDPYAAVHLAFDTDGVAEIRGHHLAISGVTRILVTIATATRAESWWSGVPADQVLTSTRPDIAARARDRSGQAALRGHELLLAEHIADVRGSRGATQVVVGSRRGGAWDVARDILRGGDDQLVATVMAEFGRYLLGSASRTGSPPANLQGIWNDDLRPAWSSNYTLNINTQMNYWAVDVAGLTDSHSPLAELLGRLARNGADVARALYGARGWVAHHNTDMWGWALPVGMGRGNPSWAIWMTGGTWLAQQLWDHYDFTRDESYLRDIAWPILRGAAEFGLDWLVDDGAGGLRVLPSTSPENLFVGPDGHPESLGASTSIDIALITSLFQKCRAALAVLGGEWALDMELADALERLPAPGFTADGRLREWQQDVTEVNPHHRHLSPLVGLFPLDLITLEQTPAAAEGARRSLEARGPGAMGWSWAWKIALRARLGEGDTARALLIEATQPYEHDPHLKAPIDTLDWGALLPNLFSTHPPFQADGNFGFTAAIIEMLVQSHGGRIRLLPALPRAWATGSATGIGARGGLRVDISWSSGELEHAVIHNVGASPVTIPVDYRGRSHDLTIAPGASAGVPGVSHAS
ncbi:MAG: hypothetical protein JWP19_314 [Rhodoglobus sp.]|nr:hypothetical protein [Rhodoglobus sp.]